MVRWTFTSIGILFVLLNAMQVTIGFARLLRALAAEPISKRFADALQTAWMFLGILGIAVGTLLILIAKDAAAGDPVARKVGVAIGVALVAAGIGSFLATRAHPGLLLISAFGAIVLLALFTN